MIINNIDIMKRISIIIILELTIEENHFDRRQIPFLPSISIIQF